ncbi:MAG TPA: hypothetical protein VFH88_13500 [Candidatus Krumholzibacteria bacterium]|nr:hypothetical protein [Candidatus Krumholzibacteria bacterium]
MRNAILVSILAGVLVVGAAAVYAGAPIAGTYKSTNGDFDEGTATSSWTGDFLSPGNVLYGQSSAGGVFTNDWTIQCPMVVAVTPLGPPLGPTGNFSYLITYAGGYVTLGGPGNPWDGGDAVYTGAIDTYIEIRTIQTAGGLITGAVSNHNVSAHIQGYPSTCIAWAIGNGVLRGGTPPGAPLPFLYPTLQSVKPAGYPDYHFPGCTSSPNGVGHWDDIRDLTLSIQGCAVATQQSTWGNVKAMYRK